MKLPVSPNRDLGQHFLVDENILGVIERLAGLDPDDVVLEIGPGLGVLTDYLAERVARVHAVELDRALEPHLAERLTGRTNIDLHFGDALRFDLAALEPRPGKLVANLPYNIATPLVVESLDGLPSIGAWTVMVQREVADRFFAAPSTKAYGAVSVLVQLVTERTGFHPVSRTVFRPPPNVDSALVAFSRTGLPESYSRGQARRRSRFRAPPQDAPELARALGARATPSRSGSPRSDRPATGDPRRGTRAARVRRPGRGASVSKAKAHAKINLALVVGPRRPDGKHEVATVLQQIELADGIVLEQGSALEVMGFTEDTLVRDALLALGAAASAAPSWTVRIDKQIPVAAGLGGGSSDAAAALRLANETLAHPLPEERLQALAAEIGADVPFFLTEGAQLGTGDGTRLEPVEIPHDYWVVLVLPVEQEKASTAAVYEAFQGVDGFDERRASLREALRSGELAALPPNDLASSPLADELRALGAFRADVTGAGPAVYGLFDDRDRAEAARLAVSPRGRTWLTAPAWYG